MKKYLLSGLLMLIALSASAQKEVGSWSVVPRIGVNIANMTNATVRLNADNDETMGSKAKAGMTAGADIEYVFINNLSASIGAYYSMQGCKFDDFVFTEGTTYTGHNDARVNTQYVNAPLMINYYIIDGLAVKAGVQIGFLLNAKTSQNTSNMTKKEDGTFDHEESVTVKKTVTDMFKSTDISIPIGVSYEYENVVLDVRYNIGLTNVYKPSAEENQGNMPSTRNNTFMFTLGYRLNL